MGVLALFSLRPSGGWRTATHVVCSARPGWESGELVTGLMPGSYLIEFKKADGLDAPPPATVVIANGEVRTVHFAYNPELEAPSSSIRTKSFEQASPPAATCPTPTSGRSAPTAGSFSGFVVKPRVVASHRPGGVRRGDAGADPRRAVAVPARQRGSRTQAAGSRAGSMSSMATPAQREADNTPGRLPDCRSGPQRRRDLFPGGCRPRRLLGIPSNRPGNSPLVRWHPS